MTTTQSVSDWLSQEGRFLPTMELLLDGYCRQLLAHGVPVNRLVGLIVTLHPQIRAVNLYWRDGVSEVVDRLHGQEKSPTYLHSPGWAVLDDGQDMVRRHLYRDADDFPVLAELREQGFVDYIMLPLHFCDRSRHAISYTTRDPGGFTDEHIALFQSVEAPLSMLLELLRQRSIASILLRTYVGPRTGEEVLHGRIQRGDRRELDAVVLVADMRDFTSLTASLPKDQLLARLDGFFGVGVDAIHANGGEVLKFIGDALLAVFPYSETAAASAWTAATVLLSGLAAHTHVGVALHRGEVIYGNVGGADRLDFTVIGTAVNATARMADLCKVLQQDLIASETVVQDLDVPLLELGEHTLRGLNARYKLYAPAVVSDEREAV